MKTSKLIDKVFNLSIKKKELNLLLEKLGFQCRQGKGSHEVWSKGAHIITVATHNKEVPRYIVQQLAGYLRDNDLFGEDHDEKETEV